MSEQVHAYVDDVLADHDGIALAALIRNRDVSRREVLDAALARAQKVDGQLNAIQLLDPRALEALPTTGPFSGVPVFIKDNLDVAGLPTGLGSEAFVAKPAKHDAPFTKSFREQGFALIGKSRLPEFGYNATTEFMTGEPARNPWDTARSTGASSGGSAALVAAGVVPLAHANDGGGSIRIPAACCGLVGLKSTRWRFRPGPLERVMPVNLISEGVVSRTVRDTAHFVAAAEVPRRKLPAIGLVEGPSTRRLRVGLVLDSGLTSVTDDETRAAVLQTAALLEQAGHVITEVASPLDEQLAADFELYWCFLGFMTAVGGSRLFPGFDPSKLDGLTVGLAERFRAGRRQFPGAVARLRRSDEGYVQAFAGVDVILSPVLVHTTPEIGHLSPTVPFETLFARLLDYIGFTPLNNATGSPAISLPMGKTATGLPIGVQVMAKPGDERTLLEIAYELEEAAPFRRLG